MELNLTESQARRLVTVLLRRADQEKDFIRIGNLGRKKHKTPDEMREYMKLRTRVILEGGRK